MSEKDSFFSRMLVSPFHIFYPPVLNTPVSTLKLPKHQITTFGVFTSFFVIISGLIYCFVNKQKFFFQDYDLNGKPQLRWYTRSVSDQVITEGLLNGFASCMCGFSLICGYYALTNSNVRTLKYKMMYRIGLTFPIWIILLYELYHIKIPYYIPSLLSDGKENM